MAAGSALSVVFEDVGHAFGPHVVFAGVNCTISAGQVCVVTGPNGSGKSTLLRITAGLLTPTSGTARVIADGGEQGTLARRRYMGYLSPELALYRELTGAQNIQFFGRLRGRRFSVAEVTERLDRVGLRGCGQELVGAYSSGMRQRLKYAFALLTDPAILVLDEPTINLDTDGKAMVDEVLTSYRRSTGGLAVVATTDPNEERWADELVRLDNRALVPCLR